MSSDEGELIVAEYEYSEGMEIEMGSLKQEFLDKKRAYNRHYSARVREDPERRMELNAKKRESMRRLFARRKQERDQQNDPMDEECPEGAPKKVNRKDYKEYYDQNKERMRKNNQKYSQKVRADPEKRAILNEKKKLAMRRLKERRMLEKLAGKTPVIVKRKGQNRKKPTAADAENDSTIPGHFKTEGHSEPNEGLELNDTDALAYEGDEADTGDQESHQLDYESSVAYEYETLEDAEDITQEYPEEFSPATFPITSNLFNGLSPEHREHFIVYMENCASQYQEMISQTETNSEERQSAAESEFVLSE